MPQITMTFTLPDERVEARQAQFGGEAHSALWDIQQEIRKILKYEDLSGEQSEMAERIEKIVFDAIEYHGINFDE